MPSTRRSRVMVVSPSVARRPPSCSAAPRCWDGSPPGRSELAGRSLRFWLPAIVSGAGLVFAAWLVADADAAGHAGSAGAPATERLALDLAYGERARGRVVLRAGVLGGSLDVRVSVSGLSLPRLGAERSARVELSVSPLCSGRFGRVQRARTVEFRAPAEQVSLPELTLKVPFACAGGRSLRLFARAKLVALAPMVVLRSASGSIPLLRPVAPDAG